MNDLINRQGPSKFRLYDEKYRCWSNEPIMAYPGSPLVKQGHVIQWWTGLIDINHKEIYEGDIVKTIDSGMGILFGEPKYTRGEITWLREAFCICQSYVGGNELSNYIQCECCAAPLEIIGNRFDNPELLEDCPLAKEMRENGTN